MMCDPTCIRIWGKCWTTGQLLRTDIGEALEMSSDPNAVAKCRIEEYFKFAALFIACFRLCQANMKKTDLTLYFNVI